MNKFVPVIISLTATALILLFVNAISNNNPTLANPNHEQENVTENLSADENISGDDESNFIQEIHSILIPQKLSFAEESVPLDEPDVKERMDRELLVNSYWHSNTIQLFKLAHKFFPVIEPILKENGVPDDVKYVALIESGLRNLISPKDATGIWQFLDETGKNFGLEINAEVDERYHLEKSTEAACKYFLEAHERFGSWTLAAASYNMGMQGLENTMERQKANNYYDLYLRDETSRYIFRIIAVKEIFENAKTYGYLIDDSEKYNFVPYKVVTVDTAITDLASFALDQGTNYKNLKLLNEWLRGSSLSNKSGKSYEIKIRQ